MKKTSAIVLLSLFTVSLEAYQFLDLQMSARDQRAYLLKSEKYEFAATPVIIKNSQGLIKTSADELNTRGKGSIKAPRRNFAIKFAQKQKFETLSAKNINLISMWVDQGYLSTKLGFELMRVLNPIVNFKSEYTEVKINGQTNGLYLLVEKPKSAVDSPFFIRRRGGGVFEFTNEQGQIAEPQAYRQFKPVFDQYNQIIAEKSGREFVSEISKIFDFKTYMNWMILNSLLQNGDGADEVFYFIDQEKLNQGDVYLRILAWDFDDLFQPMHRSQANKNAKLKYPQSIIYNFEDRLDAKIAQDPYLYDLLKSQARSLLHNELSMQNIQKTFENIYAEAEPYYLNQDVLDQARKDRTDGQMRSKGYQLSDIKNIYKMRLKSIQERHDFILNQVK